MKNVNAVIRNKLEAQGMPVAVLGKRTGINYDRLYKCLSEKYSRKLSSVEFIKICVVLNLNLNDFIEAA